MSQKARSKHVSLKEINANKEKVEKAQVRSNFNEKNSNENKLNQLKSRYSMLDQIKMNKVTTDLTQLGLIPEEKNLATSMNSQDKTKQQELNIIKALKRNGQENVEAFPNITTSNADLRSYLLNSTSIVAIASTVALAYVPKANKEAIGKTQRDALSLREGIDAFLSANSQDNKLASSEKTALANIPSAYSKVKSLEIFDKVAGLTGRMFTEYSEYVEMVTPEYLQAYPQVYTAIMTTACICAVTHIPEAIQKIKNINNKVVHDKTSHEPSQNQEINTDFNNAKEVYNSAEDAGELLTRILDSSNSSTFNYAVFASNVFLQLKEHLPYIQTIFEDRIKQVKSKFSNSKNTDEEVEDAKTTILEKKNKIEQNEQSISASLKATTLSNIASEIIEEPKQVEDSLARIENPTKESDICSEIPKKIGQIEEEISSPSDAPVDSTNASIVPENMHQIENKPVSKIATEEASISPEIIEEPKQVEDNLPIIENSSKEANLSAEILNEIEQREVDIPSAKHATNKIEANLPKKTNQLTL